MKFKTTTATAKVAATAMAMIRSLGALLRLAAVQFPRATMAIFTFLRFIFMMSYVFSPPEGMLADAFLSFSTESAKNS